jgi:cysteinyl-tRNA synthetase
MATLKLHNTLTKSLESFEPLAPGGPVLLYSCGPTVYSYAHIGNFRSFLLADLLRRVLEMRGFAVRHVMNITDVGHLTEDHLADAAGEDKLSKAARELGKDPYQIAAHFERCFVEDATTLRLANYRGAEAQDQTRHPRATAFVAEMLAMIQSLIERGFAYVDAAGQVYFEIAKFPEYGQLSGKDLDELREGVRVEVREEKRDPRDFALWKVDPGHLMKWNPHDGTGFAPGAFARLQALVPGGLDPRLGVGFPGWHIECSAMARACLGPIIDIHTGGEDNIFPHHECEIAQSFGAHGDTTAGRKSFARYWLHGRHLLVDGRKMSKRDGTFYTVRDLLDPERQGRADLVAPLRDLGFDGGRVPATVLRHALMSNAYGQSMNFTLELLGQAKASVDRLQSLHDRLRERIDAAPAGPGSVGPGFEALLAGVQSGFDAALADDLNMPNALAEVFRFVREVNAEDPGPAASAKALEALGVLDGVLDVLDRRVRAGLITTAELQARAAAKPPAPSLPPEGEPLSPALVAALLVERHAARLAKEFGRADAARDTLKRRGVVIEDTPHGVRWKLP